MFCHGDLVVYGIHGVCRIIDIEKRDVNRKKVEYYVLVPLSQAQARFYVPTGNENAVSKLRPILSREELDDLLHSEKVNQQLWISDENARKQYYRTLINSGDRASLIQMVKVLHKHKQHQQEQGRKFHLSDENFLRDAEKLLGSEFALILDIPNDEVLRYILR